MRVVVIGGSGHIGTWLIPRLVGFGHEVVNVSRAQRAPYQPHGAWNAVTQVSLDRGEEERDDTFGTRIARLEPDAVIDLICFTPRSARQMVDALRGRVRHFLHCGTIWVHGPTVQPPVTEEQPRRPFGDYGIQKAAIEDLLLDAARRDGFPATVLHPGHIVGPGWIPLNPAGNFDPQVFARLARGEEVALPNLGMETVHHVHADDVAAAFVAALQNWSTSVGESFHVVSPAALTLRGYAEAVAAWYGAPARLSFLPWDAWRAGVDPAQAQATWDHIAHSPCCSIEKARRRIGYAPRYGSLEAVFEALEWQRATPGSPLHPDTPTP